jgi:hypothetical protein
MIDPRIIAVEDGHNPRDYNIPENRAHLDDLKASIRENGTISPLWVRYDAERRAAVLVDGECRLRAKPSRASRFQAGTSQTVSCSRS